ncbi:phospholipase [Spirosoma aureum]|uniref:Phospholipase n=1 Tax=Spirosoma aureum TaxID=2692134 RepID=A0A6G9AXQ3_9BACT|nr:phospholipase [Spirosoma aureum]QIP17128.1 phospholipase [Spirosoma aureum]
MIEHHLSVKRTARYYTIGALTDRTKNIWFCLHGFGQLAQYFGRKFTSLSDDQTLIIVPEGLSRLYLDNDYQRIGASWLTREDRECEISDFLAYLNSLYDLILEGHSTDDLHVTLLGFSQGAATACRWLNDSHIRANRLILWAGYFPNGLRELIDPDKLKNVDTHYVYGRQDQYIAQLDNVDRYLYQLQIDAPGLKITPFNGGHQVNPDVLTELVAGS